MKCRGGRVDFLSRDLPRTRSCQISGGNLPDDYLRARRFGQHINIYKVLFRSCTNYYANSNKLHKKLINVTVLIYQMYKLYRKIFWVAGGGRQL